VSEPRVATDRLILTPLETSDAEALFGYRSDTEVCRYQTWELRSLEDARRAQRAVDRAARAGGMRQEVHFRESLWFKGEWADDVVFGILASEWGR
jgi:RimJ/RimL family protein N-acetyltransferase